MRAKIQAVLNRKVRLKITRRKRGRFRVVIPAGLAGFLNSPDEEDPDQKLDGYDVVIAREFTRKTDALTWLLVKLRCLTPQLVRVELMEDSK
jgi:hypothetical protein